MPPLPMQRSLYSLLWLIGADLLGLKRSATENILKNSIRMLPFACFLLLSTNYSPIPIALAQQPQKSASGPVLRVSDSHLFSLVSKYRKEHRNAQPSEIADFANQELQNHGYDFDFDIAGFIEKNRLKPIGRCDRSMVECKYSFSLLTIKDEWVKLEASVSDSGPCGERGLVLPTIRVTSQEVWIIQDGKILQIKRPSSFVLEEMELVKRDLKTPVRKWEVPSETRPLGVSEDGRTLFLEAWVSLGGTDPDLTLGVSENGTRFYANDRLPRMEESQITRFAPDPKNDYLSYSKFQVGKMSHIVRYTAPCT
jgi:hypothetical protein